MIQLLSADRIWSNAYTQTQLLYKKAFYGFFVEKDIHPNLLNCYIRVLNLMRHSVLSLALLAFAEPKKGRYRQNSNFIRKMEKIYNK